MIKAIIFDLGGVVVFELYSDSWKGIFKELGEKNRIEDSVLIDRFQRVLKEIYTGKLSLLDFYRKVLLALGRKDVKPESLVKDHLDIYKEIAPFDREMIGFILLLRERYRVVCLSNTEKEIGEHVRERGLLSNFEKSFLSPDLGMQKPDQRIYRHVIKALGIKPREAVFIDNKQEYVDASIKAGMKGILFVNIKQLKEDLEKIGVKPF